LYNESPLGVIDPTPTIAMVGLIDDEKHITTQWFKNAGDVIILLDTVAGGDDPGSEETGDTKRAEVTALGYNLGGSRYLKVCHGLKIGPPPHVDLAHEIKVQNAVRDLIREGVVQSAHDCSEGGLAVSLAESCFNPERLFGADVALKAGGRPAATVLFNEAQSRIVISVTPEHLDKAIGLLRERDVPFQQLGKVGGDELQIRIDEQTFQWRVAEIYDDWWNAIRRAVDQDESIPSL
jgi:phosphoribosylformylglycinamidine synthase